jgi:hypothetical protein
LILAIVLDRQDQTGGYPWPHFGLAFAIIHDREKIARSDF